MAAKTATTTPLDEFILFLSENGEVPVSEAIRFGEPVLSAAWAKGYVEFGRTKYVVAGNPAVPASEPCVIVEGGIDWGGPKTARHGRLRDVLAWQLPACDRYQKYQQEVLVNRQKDVWEWVESPDDVKGREVRWARRDSDRKEAESLCRQYVRVTDKGVAVLQGGD